MSFVIPAPKQPVLPIVGTDQTFPIHRVYCVGRNYADHAREMGHDPDREPPFFFQKNPDNVLLDDIFPYPDKSSNVHFEMELIVALKSGGADIPESQALDHIYGYAVGLDMTRRDLQGEAKKLGRPWEVGKAFDHSAPCSPIRPKSQTGPINEGRIWLNVNGALRQDGNLNQMIWNIPETISYLAGLFTLAAGDLIMTGTPAGVGPIQKGDRLHGGVDGVGEIEIEIG